MATQTSNNSSAEPGTASNTAANTAADAASTTVGLGGVTSGQAGATPQHETQQETGGGGAQLTHSTGDIDSAPGQAEASTPAAPEPAPEADGSAVQSGARGAQDTRGQQAGGTGTGLGSPETGANQSEADLPPAR
jgi:hypothetical protein